MHDGSLERAGREVAHSRKIASKDPERIWGWNTLAGRVRAMKSAELISRAAYLRPGIRVLEIGCSTGLFTEMFAKTDAQIVAVDISKELMEIAKSRGLPINQVTFLEKRFENWDIDGPFNAEMDHLFFTIWILGRLLQGYNNFLYRVAL